MDTGEPKAFYTRQRDETYRWWECRGHGGQVERNLQQRVSGCSAVARRLVESMVWG
ncbi:unnamed protein product [Ectocarpus sp. CCAP 1310/34]|nr:unnamed protein product [Ectocarpus sp. CCAP 1310/34]